MSERSSEISIEVKLNEEKVPTSIRWVATDQPEAGTTQSAKAMLLAFFDKDTKDTLKIDLWTREMQVVEMDRFFYQTLRGLADTYFKATGNKELAGEMQRFVRYFGEETEIVPKG
jgi:gliding motility-associated protein GldC